MVKVMRSIVDGPLAPYVAGFAEELLELGYTQNSAEQHVCFIAHLDRWLLAEGLGVADLSDSMIERYLSGRQAAGYVLQLSTKAMRPLLAFLGPLDVLPPAPPARPDPVEELLDRYRGYLLTERGLTPATVVGYVHLARPFLASRLRGDRLDLAGLSAAEVVGFVLASCPGRATGTAKLIVTVTRSLLGWLHLTGMVEVSLASSVPAVAGWKLAGRPGRDRLTGTVEVDETYIGGEEPGLRGGHAKGKKALVGIAVELHEPRGYGRARMAILADGSAKSLHAFVTDHVEPGARVITDGWAGYQSLDKLGYTHEPRSQRAARARGEDPGELLPAVHRVASLAKRWLLGTHQGSVDEAHLQSYLNEFVFRFNRRRSRSRGMVFYRVLELAVAHPPVRCRDLVADPKPKRTPPSPPASRGHLPSLDRPRAAHPWRAS